MAVFNTSPHSFLSARVYVEEGGRLVLTETLQTDEGIYVCTASNMVGTRTSRGEAPAAGGGSREGGRRADGAVMCTATRRRRLTHHNYTGVF